MNKTTVLNSQTDHSYGTAQTGITDISNDIDHINQQMKLDRKLQKRRIWISRARTSRKR